MLPSPHRASAPSKHPLAAENPAPSSTRQATTSACRERESRMSPGGGLFRALSPTQPSPAPCREPARITHEEAVSPRPQGPRGTLQSTQPRTPANPFHPDVLRSCTPTLSKTCFATIIAYRPGLV